MKDARNPYAYYNVDDLYQFLSGYTLLRDPGSEFEYSNLGAGILGHLLAYRAGTDYESLIRIRITRPLRMPDTGITLSPSMKQRMATGHKADPRARRPKRLGPFPRFCRCMRSFVNDMLTFLEAFLGYKESPHVGRLSTNSPTEIVSEGREQVAVGDQPGTRRLRLPDLLLDEQGLVGCTEPGDQAQGFAALEH